MRARERAVEQFDLAESNAATCQLLARLAQKAERTTVQAVTLGKPAARL
ncbi:MAG TPA: hypothetical protein VFB54_06765 [Burkholderiales bacterium]|nr:hypothetical protein [Burkholderiales bacterium]